MSKRQDRTIRCTYEFAPGVQCEKIAGHEEPYYPYLDYGQAGWYSKILSEGTKHIVTAPAPECPPEKEWTGNERKDREGYETWEPPKVDTNR